jgi:glycosyltransferase involved in cell wall biosynthesis
MKGIIIIPAYNSASTLPDLLEELSIYSDLEIVVVDDGSKDDTHVIAQNRHVYVIRHEHNKGKGAAIKTGYRYAATKNIDFVITIDADKQHPPDHIPAFIKEHEKHPDSVILGMRKRDTHMPLIRKFSNSTLSTLISWRIGQHLYDSQCGYRLIPGKYLSWNLSKINGFIFESESLITFSDNGVEFRFVSIPTLYPQGGQSKITYIESTLDFFSMYFSSFFKSYKRNQT